MSGRIGTRSLIRSTIAQTDGERYPDRLETVFPRDLLLPRYTLGEGDGLELPQNGSDRRFFVVHGTINVMLGAARDTCGR
jgi:hypothetical protein